MSDPQFACVMAKHHRQAEVPEQLQEAGGLVPGAARTVSLKTLTPEAEVYGVGSFFHLLANPNTKIRVCTGLSCKLAGADKLLAKMKQAGMPVEGCSCLAACDQPPAALREREVIPAVTVGDVDAARGDWRQVKPGISAEGDRWLGHIGPSDADPTQLALNLQGQPDHSGDAIEMAHRLGPDAVIERVKSAGLQGRGGAGFPAHIKWTGVRNQSETKRYVVLNADEGEPGTFKDREVLMRRPDLVVEGLAIAAYTVGADEIYLYLRGEFAIPKQVLREAIESLRSAGQLEGLSFHFHDGQGAYICGEETALLEALEGRRGMPRLKPPFPVEQGLWGKPTLIHNVETIACLPGIIREGGDWFRGLGRTEPGTKLYCISGHVARPGTYELPLGVSLDELVDHAGGYIGTLKAFSPGGASSGFLPASMRDRPLDFKGLAEVGSMLGSAGVVVLNETVDMRWAVAQQLLFFEEESCGQCAPCRIGTRYLKEALDAAVQGDTSPGRPDLQFTDDVAWQMAEGSICGLGQIASLPLTSAQKHFPEDLR
ncbi:MAG: NADH-ubiquinone oxidoreductase-F iron-sulfur binding region domain-containing protein [Phycisphaerales bacterium JB063]